MSQNPEQSSGDEFDIAAFNAAFAQEFGATTEELSGEQEPAESDPTEPGDPEASAAEAPTASGAEEQQHATVTGVVLTPLADARELARIMGLAGITWPVVATGTGAIAATSLPVAADDVSALTGQLPEEIVNVAKALSHTSKYGVVLLSARVSEGEEGTGGRVGADRYVAGEHTEILSPGLITATADDLVEELVLGQTAADQARGAIDPTTVAADPDSGNSGPKRKRS